MNPVRLSFARSTPDPLTMSASAKPGESPFLTGPELPVPVPILVPVLGPAARELPCNRRSELLAVGSPGKRSSE